MQEEVETEAVKETDQISVGTGEGSGVGEGHIGDFHLAKEKSSGQPDYLDLCWNFNLHYLQPQAWFGLFLNFKVLSIASLRLNGYCLIDIYTFLVCVLISDIRVASH